MNEPHHAWEHPDWYDLHDAAWTAGVERDAEQFRELVLALPPLGPDDHLIDVGAGTGKVAALVAGAYSSLGRVTLLDPNQLLLERAHARVSELLPNAVVQALGVSLGQGSPGLPDTASVVTVANVLMPVLESHAGTLGDGLAWLSGALGELKSMLGPGGRLFILETLNPPWAAEGDEDDQPLRRLSLGELELALAEADFDRIECVYRFRDRVVVESEIG